MNVDKREARIPQEHDLRLAPSFWTRVRCVWTRPFGHGWVGIGYPWGFCPYCKHRRRGDET